MPFSKHGVIADDDLRLLTSVLDEHCSSFGINDRNDRETLAGVLLSTFRAGLTDRNELLQSLRRGKAREQ